MEIELKKGTVEAISLKNGGVKIGEKWYTLSEKVKPYILKVYKGDCEYNIDKSEKFVTFLKQNRQEVSNVSEETVTGNNGFKRDDSFNDRILKQICLKKSCDMVMRFDEGGYDLEKESGVDRLVDLVINVTERMFKKLKEKGY